MSTRAQFHAELRELIGSIWTECPANGIYLGCELATIPFERKVDAGQLPLAVYNPELKPSPEWGGDVDAEAGPVPIYCVVTDAVRPDELTAKLELLRRALWPPVGTSEFATFQVTAFPELSISISLPVNQYFLTARRPLYAGAVIPQILLAERPE